MWLVYWARRPPTDCSFCHIRFLTPIYPTPTDYRDAEARGYKFSAPIFFEKLTLAGFAPSPIPSVAALSAALQQPAVQAAYRADYERCNSNGKRGAIIKIFELAGVDAKLVKVRGKGRARLVGLVGCR